MLVTAINIGNASATVQLGAATRATTDTTGYPLVPVTAGTPTGVVAAGALTVDTTNHKICVSEGAGTWHCI